jgi:hypothetical protein
MGSSAAKVEIDYGLHVQKRILKTMKCSLLPLWGHFQGIFLVLVHECNFHNADKEFYFRKVILFATHPQRLFTESKGSPIAVRQDLTIEVARRLSNLEVNFDPQVLPGAELEIQSTISVRARKAESRKGNERRDQQRIQQQQQQQQQH